MKEVWWKLPLLVAYAVQMAWVFQNSRKRGRERQNWTGITTGLSSCALLGIAIALLLSEQRGLFDWLEAFGFAWALVSIGFLGLWIAILPWTMYEWTHSFNAEYSDE